MNAALDLRPAAFLYVDRNGPRFASMDPLVSPEKLGLTEIPLFAIVSAVSCEPTASAGSAARPGC